MSKSRLVRFAALAAILALTASACGGGKKKETPAKTGGTITLGAEQWPDCMNPINACAAGYWQSLQLWMVLPRSVQYDPTGTPQASDVIKELPTLQNGLLKAPGVGGDAMTLTYHIKPEAVWSDGTPITSKDYDFTWRAIMNTTGSVTTTGYDQITGVDTTGDPKTVVIHFKSIFVDWLDLFGGAGSAFGFIEAAKFPKADPKKPNLAKEYATGPITVSAGPWIQQSFSKTSATFVRNDKYWGHKPILDKMIWVPDTTQSTEVADLLSGQIVAAFPQPSNVSILQQLKVNPNAKSVAGTGTFWEAIRPNNQDPILKDKRVREALYYGIDREEIMKGLIHLNAPNEKVLNCGPDSLPGRGPWCHTTPWDKFSYQPTKSIEILKSAGWNCDKVPASPCTKGSQALRVSYRYCNGNARRQTTFDLIKEKIKPAGFAFTHSAEGNDCTDPLFTKTLPQGKFQVADYAEGPIAYDPSPTGNWSCGAIPTAKNGFGPLNDSRYCNPAADVAMKRSDTQLDNDERVKSLDEFWKIMVDDAAVLPIYVLPNITMWRADKIGGPVGETNSSPYGGFFNVDQWFLK
jgi:peptide/nickel transport system substrate-binding protein